MRKSNAWTGFSARSASPTNDALWGVYALTEAMRAEVEDFSREMPKKLQQQVKQNLMLAKQEFQLEVTVAREVALEQTLTHTQEIETKWAEARLKGKKEGIEEAKARYSKKEGGGTLRTALRLVLFVVAVAVLYEANQRGFERGVLKSQWAGTPEGQAAWQFHQEGWGEWLETDAGKAVAQMVAEGRVDWLAQVNWRKMSQWDIGTVHMLIYCKTPPQDKQTPWMIKVDKNSSRLYCETSGAAAWWLPK